jgi:hypothetical protein
MEKMVLYGFETRVFSINNFLFKLFKKICDDLNCILQRNPGIVCYAEEARLPIP